MAKKVVITPTEWVLDLMFRDAFAEKMNVFQVEDDAVLDMIGVAHDEKKRRDRYSMANLEKHLQQVDKLRGEIGAKPKDDRDPVEDQFFSTRFKSSELCGY